MELRHKSTDSSFGGAQREEARISVARRVLMFPLTRILVAVAVFVPLQLLLGYGAMVLLGGPQDASLIEFLSEHRALAASTQALAAVIALVFVGKVIEHRPLAAYGLGRRGAGSDTAKGFALGAGMISAVIGVLALAGWYDVTGMGWSQPGVWNAIAGALGLFLAVSVFEEVLFRGILFRVMEEGLGSWAALAITALIFSILHLANPNATLLGALGVVLAGVLFAAVYMLTRNLWLAIGLHWSWNFFQGAVFGVPVSGQSLEGAPISAKIAGPELWTGAPSGRKPGSWRTSLSPSSASRCWSWR